jgi:hypothetical protein
MPTDSDDRLEERTQQVLPAWSHPVTRPSDNEGNTEGRQPFLDDELKNLWITAIREDRSFIKIETAVRTNARNWPRDLNIRGLKLPNAKHRRTDF